MTTELGSPAPSSTWNPLRKNYGPGVDIALDAENRQIGYELGGKGMRLLCSA